MSKIDIILKICELLAEQGNLTTSIIQSAKGASIVGVTTFIGGLVGGRLGIVVGAAIGTAASRAVLPHFSSVVHVIRTEMTPLQRKQLADRVGKLMNDQPLQEAAGGMAILMQNPNLKKAVVNQIKGYFKSELNLDISST